MVLCGLSNDMKDKLREGIPYLRRVPVLNFFFSNKNTTARSEDLIIVLTPRVKYQTVNCGVDICDFANASMNAVARMNAEKNIWEKKCGDCKIDRMEGTQNYLSANQLPDAPTVDGTPAPNSSIGYSKARSIQGPIDHATRRAMSQALSNAVGTLPSSPPRSTIVGELVDPATIVPLQPVVSPILTLPITVPQSTNPYRNSIRGDYR